MQGLASSAVNAFERVAGRAGLSPWLSSASQQRFSIVRALSITSLPSRRWGERPRRLRNSCRAPPSSSARSHSWVVTVAKRMPPYSSGRRNRRHLSNNNTL